MKKFGRIKKLLAAWAALTFVLAVAVGVLAALLLRKGREEAGAPDDAGADPPGGTTGLGKAGGADYAGDVWDNDSGAV